MATLPTQKELKDWGAHLGHLRKVSHPSVKPYILEVQEKMLLIDPEKIRQQLEKTIDFLKTQKKSPILWVGTKVIAKDLIKEIATSLGHFYITQKWLGGMLTNFETLKKNLEKMRSLREGEESEEYKELTKKEKGVLKEKREKMEKILAGISEMKEPPKILIVFDPYYEKTAVAEARRKGLTIVGLCDVQTNFWEIDYPIPLNDDSRTTVENILKVLARVFDKDFEFAKNKKTKK
jgi:small subunit ribosomal protein S2